MKKPYLLKHKPCFGKLLLILICILCGSWKPAASPVITAPDELEMVLSVLPEEGGLTGKAVIRMLAGIPAPHDITITYTVTQDPARPAISGTDFTPLSGTATILAGNTETEIDILVTDDLLIEGTEYFQIDLQTADDLTAGLSYLGVQRGLGCYIIDNDNRISITGTQNGKEPGTNAGDDAVFTFSLPGALTFDEDVEIRYIVDGASTAIDGVDYDNTPLTGVIILPAFQNSITLSVPVTDDLIIEANETLGLSLLPLQMNSTGIKNLRFDPGAGSASVLIEDNDNTPLSILSVQHAREPGGAGNNGYFRIGWVGGITADAIIRVSYTRSGTATNNTDYSNLGGTIFIPSGQPYVDVPVNVINDDLVEGTETVGLQITATNSFGLLPTIALGATTSSTVNIIDDDDLNMNIEVVASDPAAAEPSDNGAFTLQLASGRRTTAPITITYTITGTAASGTDFSAFPVTLTAVIPANSSNVVLPVTVINDDLIEDNETVVLTITGVSCTLPFVIGANNNATVTIEDEDDADMNVEVIASDPNAAESADNGEFTIRINPLKFTSVPITVTYTVTGTAANGIDYITIGLTATIPAGDNRVLLPVNVSADDIIEGSETVIVTLTGITSALPYTIGANNNATVTIADDDNTDMGVRVTASSPNAAEPAVDGEFLFSLAPGKVAAVDVEVLFTLTGTAAVGVDYAAYPLPLRVIIPAGDNSVQLPLDVTDDLLVEGSETVILTLTSVSSALPFTTGTPNAAVVNISDNDIMSSAQWKRAAYTGTGAAGAVRAGEQITYTIHVRNTGNVPLQNIQLVDNIPTYTQFISGDNGVMYSAGQVSWTVANIAAGADIMRSFTVLVQNDLTGATNITNTAMVDNGDGTGPHPTIPSAPGDPSNPHPTPNPGDPSTNIPVDNNMQSVNWKSASYTGTGMGGSVRAGELIVYTIHIRNTGNARLTNVRISDMLPAYTSFVSAEDGVTPTAASELVWIIPDINVGAEASRSFTARVINDLTGAVNITNTAMIDNGNGGGPHPTIPSAPGDPSNPHPNPVPGDPSTSIPVDNNKTSVQWKHATYNATGANGAVAAGDLITYTIHIRNTGNASLDNVQVSDQIPPYTAFVSAEDGITPAANGRLTWTIPTIAVGAADVTKSFTVRVINDLTDATSITNTALVNNGDGNGNHPTVPSAPNDPSNPHPNPVPGTPSTSIPVDNGMRSVSWKSAAYTGTGENGAVTSGDLITYTIHVRNTGNAALRNVLITDNIPAYTQFVSAEGNVTPVNGRLEWTIPQMNVGGVDVTRSFTVRVIQDLTGATTIVNTSGVDNRSGNGMTPSIPAAPGDPGNPTTMPHPGEPATSIPVFARSTFSAWKLVEAQGGLQTARPGGTLIYTIYIRNTGNVTIPQLEIIDPVPAHTTFISAENNGVLVPADSTVHFIVSNIPVGGVATVRFRVRVNTELEGVSMISNIASVSDGTVTRPTAGCDPATAGCSGVPGTYIIVDQTDYDLYIVNAFSPNGDGKNDYFVVRGIERYPGSSLFVYNRWGGMVYQSKEYDNRWNGAGLSAGTYYYMLEIKQLQGKKLYKGWVVIIR